MGSGDKWGRDSSYTLSHGPWGCIKFNLKNDSISIKYQETINIKMSFMKYKYRSLLVKT